MDYIYVALFHLQRRDLNFKSTSEQFKSAGRYTFPKEMLDLHNGRLDFQLKIYELYVHTYDNTICRTTMGSTRA